MGRAVKFFFLSVVFVVSVVCAFAEEPKVFNLRGSPAIQAYQNTRAEKEGLSRIPNDAALRRMKAKKLLVALPKNKNVVVDQRLKKRYRYARPWTEAFLVDLGASFRKEFPKARPLQVNSAVRTEASQRSLRRINGNAAKQSSHVVGSTVDIAKKGLTREEIGYLRRRLAELMKQGLIVAVEERRQAVFHVYVENHYPIPPTKPTPAKKRQRSPLIARK